MFENIPEMIKRTYVITICISVISLIAGVITEGRNISGIFYWKSYFPFKYVSVNIRNI